MGPFATKTSFRIGAAFLAATFGLCIASPINAQSNTAPVASADANQTAPTNAADAQARRRAARRRQRARAQQQAQQQTPQAAPAQVAPSADQRSRDAQILELQKAQSAATARENDAVTRQAVRSQQQQQGEPRIQDAPGQNSQPLPGEPAVQPSQPADPPRIQDAPGPTQTLPKPPPAPQH